MTASRERGLWIADAAHRADLCTFAGRALRLDDAAVIRLRSRADGLLAAWVLTGFDVLAARVIAGRLAPSSDFSCGADQLVSALGDSGADGFVDPGYPMDSAWRGALPPETGFVHVDDVPAAVLAELARRGADLASEHGSAHGPPASLLDQEVLQVSSGDTVAAVPMRCVFALTAMGFVPEPPASDEIVRIRVLPSWLRMDARFGSVYRRRGDPAVVLR